MLAHCGRLRWRAAAREHEISTALALLAQVQAAVALQGPPPQGAVARLQAVAAISAHALVHVRVAWVKQLVAAAAGNRATAVHAAAQMGDTARRAGLLEPLAEARLLQAQSAGDGSTNPAASRSWALQAAALATQCGLADVQRRAQAWQADQERGPAPPP